MIDPRFSDQADAWRDVRTRAAQVQLWGAEVAKIADAAIANIAPAETVYRRYREILPNDPTVQRFMNDMAVSGSMSLRAAVHVTDQLNGQVSGIREVFNMAATGITYANVGTTAALQNLVPYAPPHASDISKWLGVPELRRAFTDEQLDALLDRAVDGLGKRRRGAWQTFHSGSPEAIHQSCHSMREILNAGLIGHYAKNDQLEACAHFKRLIDGKEKLTVAHRIQFLLHGCKDLSDDALNAVADWAEDDRTLKKIAHGSSRSIEEARLLLKRSEELLYLILLRLDRLGSL